MGSGDIKRELQELKEAYLTSLPAKVAELEQLLKQIREQADPQAIEKLKLLAHRLKGTSATYGLLPVADCAAELEHSLLSAPANGNIASLGLERQLQNLQLKIGQVHSEYVDNRKAVGQAGGGRLLVVDDDPDFLSFMSTILAQHGCSVTTTSDPERVPDLVDDYGPELLLIDVDMPVVSGYQLCRMLRNQERTKSLPIIFLTAHDAQDHRITAFRAGADDFINKPIVVEELLARVEVRMARARLMRDKLEMLERLQRQHESLLAILDQLHIGTIMIGDSGSVLFMSQSCRSLGGVAPEQAVGKSWKSVLPFDKKSLHAIELQLLQGSRHGQRLHVSWRRGGEQFYVDCEIRELPANPGLHLLYLYDQSELHRLRQEIEQNRFHQMLGSSDAMRRMYGLIEQVARGDWTVLVEGETGVGKELVAHSIHAASPRKDMPFIAVNSAGLSETLLSSQLFGHRRGAFTGAVSDQEGFFEAASGGTLFLDEIGDIPLTMQAALLRVLQEKEITRLGESRTRKIDVRIIAATHKDLAGEVRAGRFREDLLYRLRVARVYVPSLRERKEDIPMLAQAFLAESCRMAQVPVKPIGPDAMTLLQNHDWPGNVRELKATVDYAVIRSRGETVTAADLPPELQRTLNGERPLGADHDDSRPEAEIVPPQAKLSAEDQRRRILNALEQAHGNRTLAAKLLGVSRATFYRHLKDLGISPVS